MYGGNTTEILLVSMHVTVTNKLASFAYAFVPSCLRNNCLIRLLIGRELDYLFVKPLKVINYATLRSPFVTLLLTNKTVRRLPSPFDGDCSAGRIVALGVYVVVVFTRTPLVNEESTPRRLPKTRW